METVKLNEKDGILIPNKSGCTNFGAIALDGKRLFALKTAQSNKKSALLQYQDYKSDKLFKATYYVDLMGHGNGLAFYGGKIYVAPLDKYVQILDEKAGLKRTRLSAPININSIAHYKSTLFFAGLSLIRITDKVELVKRYKLVWDDPDFPIGQDIGFYKGCLYIIRSSSGKNQNVILRCPFDRSVGTLTPDRVYISKSSTTLYEFESIDFYGSSMIIAANVAEGKDRIFTAKA